MTRPFATPSLRKLAAFASAAVALFVIATSIAITVRAYSPLPFYDSWGYFDPSAYTPAFFFAQHNEHRIAVPAVFFLADLLLDRGTNTLLLVLNYLCIAATAALLLLHLPRNASRSDRLLAGALAAALLFSAMQYTNIVWGFQLQFFLDLTLSIAAIVAASATRRPSIALPAAAAAIACATLATFSLASGMLAWPIIVLVAARRATRPLIPRAIAVAGVAVIALYFVGFNFAALTYATWDIGKMLAFGLAYLGAPAGTVIAGAAATLLHLAWPAEIVSACAGVVVSLLSIRLIATGARRSATRADVVLAAIALDVLLMAAVTAHGRALLPLAEAISPRYTTPSLILFAVLALGALQRSWAVDAEEPGPVSRGFVVYALVAIALLAVHQPAKMTWANIDHGRYQRAALAMEVGVYDPEAWRALYPDPPQVVPIVARLRKDGLSLFARDAKWVAALGAPVDGLAPAQTRACAGNVDSTAPVDRSSDAGERASGWSSPVDGGAAERIVFAGADGRIQGYAEGGDPRPDVQATHPEAGPDAGWTGYVRAGSAGDVTAYAVRGTARCALSGARAKAAAPRYAVKDARIGAEIPSLVVHASGTWNMNPTEAAETRPAYPATLYVFSGTGYMPAELHIGPFTTKQRSVIVAVRTTAHPAGKKIELRDAFTGRAVITIDEPIAAWTNLELPIPASARAHPLELVATDTTGGEGIGIALPRAVR